jgi:hypothetical protein
LKAQPKAPAVSELLGLPKWLTLGAETRLRWEGFSGQNFDPDRNDHYLLTRVRLNVGLKPTPWLQLFAQAQDAHVAWNELIPHAPPFESRFDLRQAWFELGRTDSVFQLRAGRQEIIFGDQRLVGAADWGNVGRVFDAIRVNSRLGKTRATVFSSSVVIPDDLAFDHHVQGNNLHGAWLTRDVRWLRLEPFAFWHVGGGTRSETGRIGRFDLWTWGVQAAGKPSAHLELGTDLARQQGTVVERGASAWAGFWWAKYRFLRVDYNYATGDRDPRDGRRQTFTLIYPTPHDKYGLADQVGWRNIHHVAIIAEHKPSAKWTLQAKFHSWWLASATDALYNAGGQLLLRDATGRSGRFVGNEVDGQFFWNANPYTRVGGGLGYLIPGEFIRNTSPGSRYLFPYVSLQFNI